MSGRLMIAHPESERDSDREPSPAWRRIKTVVLGTVVVIVVSFALTCVFTYTQYGVTPLDGLFPRKKAASPAAGKLAYDKGTKYYIGIIKGEGYSQRQGKVYYIEQAGGSMIEVSKNVIEVREPKQEGK